MKIRKIWIKGYNQFKDIFIDFTHPETGEAVDKVCFIGGNGTGKSTLLRLIKEIFSGSIIQQCYAIEMNLSGRNAIFFNKFIQNGQNTTQDQLFLDASITEKENWFNYVLENDGEDVRKKFEKDIYGFELFINRFNEMQLQNNVSDLLIYSPPEGTNSSYSDIKDVPETNVNFALGLFSRFPFYHNVSSDYVRSFWTILIYLIKQRQEEQEKFETTPENINKTKKDLIAEFDAKYPRILKKLAEVWDKILEDAGLYFNADEATNPIQLTDNLWAYIYTKETKIPIEYNQLSTGIRNFIFRIGHIYSLYFNREIKNGIVLIDEPENSLFPDFLYDLVETYQKVLVDKNGDRNSQLFMATHSPIIAAQFEPYERIILEWDEPGSVKAHKGSAPVWDDPNDILKKDFGISNLMGKKGEMVWQEYLQMKKKFRNTADTDEKATLEKQITKLGGDYNFSV